MKNSNKILILGGLLLVAFLSLPSCDKSVEDRNPPPTGNPDTLILKINETKTLQSGLKIGFPLLIEDSRCPINADCIWQGRAMCQFLFEKNGVSKLDSLAIGAWIENAPVDSTIFLTQKIRLLEVNPHQNADSLPIPASEYWVKLLIED
jgi:hypothetical protein